MKRNNKISCTVYAVIWSNIKRYQYLYSISDDELSQMLGITKRTLYSYEKDPSHISLKCLQLFLDNSGNSIEMLFSSLT